MEQGRPAQPAFAQRMRSALALDRVVATVIDRQRHRSAHSNMGGKGSQPGDAGRVAGRRMGDSELFGGHKNLA